jgi:hypothetical protein
MTDRFAAREHRRLTGRDAFAGLTPTGAALADAAVVLPPPAA